MLHIRSTALLLALLLFPAAGAHAADLLFAPVSTAGSPVDSASILRSALEARGRIVVRSDSLTGFVLENYDAVWVCLGVYPFTHPLTFSEGTKLKRLLEAGGTLMVEGGDVWGYDTLTPFHSIDGIAASADGGSDLDRIEGVLAENGQDWRAVSATYTGENTHLDHIYADLPGASVVLSKEGGAYDVGVLHLGARSNLADFRFLGISFEFGGVTSGRDDLLDEILIAFDLAPDCRLDPPTTPSCAFENQRVELRWSNLAPYSALEVLRDDIAIALLPPTVTSYVDVAPPSGVHTYVIRAVGAGECAWVSDACTVAVPFADMFRRGDTNHSAHINITDAIQLLAALFVPDSLLDCPDAGDVNDSGVLDITDPVLLLRYIFEGGLPPLSPGITCGIDPTADLLPACQGSCMP